LHIAKENFIGFDRYHPDGIALAHMAFADAKGLDSPECIELAEQYAISIDSSSTGTFVHDYKKPQSVPHYLGRSGSSKGAYRSNTVLGRLHDAAVEWATSRSTASLTFAAAVAGARRGGPAPTGPTVDACGEPEVRLHPDILAVSPSVKQLRIALALRRLYVAEVQRLDALYWNKPPVTTSYLLRPIIDRLQVKFRLEFERQVSLATSLDERLGMAAAWYIVDYGTAWCEGHHSPDYSFAWLADDHLALILTTSRMRRRALASLTGRIPMSFGGTKAIGFADDDDDEEPSGSH
jgi:hypothetical protein